MVERIKSQIEKESINGEDILAVGISWPGPARNNRIAGTSGILENFPPLQKWIVNNKIEDIMNLEFIEAFKEVWRNMKISKALPFAVLINDGDADASGALKDFIDTKRIKAKRKSDLEGSLVVIKLGTGTAGAVFLDGRKEPGLSEWGKIVLDLAAEPDKDYRHGVANHYLKSETCPILYKRLQNLEPGNKDIDSIELDLALRTIDGEQNASEKLRTECGIRQLSKELNNKFDVEQIRTAFDDENSKDREHIECFFGRPLEKVIYGGGDYRIGNIISLDGTELKQLIVNKTRLKRIKKLSDGKSLIERCARAMGNYLGDFIMLLYDLYQRDKELKVILGGGVLSGKIGKIAKETVIKRIKKYDANETLVIKPEDSLITIIPKPKKPSFEVI